MEGQVMKTGALINYSHTKRLSAILLAFILVILCVPGVIHNQSRAAENGIRRVSVPVPGQYIVSLTSLPAGMDIDPAADILAARYGGRVLHTYRHAFWGFAVGLPEAAAQRLSQDPFVAYVEEDGQGVGGDTQYNPPWGLDRVDQRALCAS